MLDVVLVLNKRAETLKEEVAVDLAQAKVLSISAKRPRQQGIASGCTIRFPTRRRVMNPSARRTSTRS
jgi:hypothetical protein